MLYMFGNIFLYGVRFDILYNEITHENMKKYKFFSLTELKKIVFKAWTEVHENSTVSSYTCIK